MGRNRGKHEIAAIVRNERIFAPGRVREDIELGWHHSVHRTEIGESIGVGIVTMSKTSPYRFHLVLVSTLSRRSVPPPTIHQTEQIPWHRG